MKRLLSILFLLGLAGGLYAQFIPGVVASSKMVEEDELLKYTDNFNSYSNGSLVGQGDWKQCVGSIAVTNGVVRSDYEDDCAVFLDKPLSNNQYAELIITEVSPTNGRASYIGVGVRMSQNNGYCFAVARDSYSFFAFVDGDGISFNFSFGDFATVGSKIRIEAEGTSIRAYIDNDLIYQVTDNNLSSGCAGLAGYNDYTSNLVTGDDWEAGEL